SATATAKSPFAIRSLTNEAGGSGTCVTVRPIAVQSRATATADAKAAGLDASSGLRSSIAIGFAADGRCQPSAACVQPAFLRAAFAAVASKATAGAAVASNSGDVGGIGPGA